MNLLEKIGSVLTTIAVGVSSFFGGQIPAQISAPIPVQNQNLGSAIPQAPALFETSLQASIGTSDTSMTLVANSLKNGNALAGYACFTIDEGLSNTEYVCGTVASTAVSGMTRGIDPLSGTTTVASLQSAHRRGADVKITDYPIVGILSRIASGIDGFPGAVHYDSNLTFSSSTQLVSMKYVDDATSTLDGTVVHKTGNETIAGVKTFSSLPTIPLTPSATTDATSKGYVDNLAFSSIISFPIKNTLLWYNGTNVVSTSTSPLYVDSIVGTSTTATSSLATALGIATSSPFAKLTVAGSGSIAVTENRLSTTTSQAIDWRSGNTQLFQMGSAAVSLSHTGYLPGMQIKVIVCNPNSTAGALTWSGVEWIGGLNPTQTTTANQCDVWSFIATTATSTTGSPTTKIFGAVSSGFQ